MPLERQRLIFFAYFNSPLYRTFLLEAAKTSGSSPLDGDLILKVWEDGFLQFFASHARQEVKTDKVVCPIPSIVNVATNQVERLSDLEELSPDDLVNLFAEIVNSGKVWRMTEDDRICDVCKSEYRTDNTFIGLLNKRLTLGRWEGFGDFAELKGLQDAGVHDRTIAKVVCLAHELWGTQLWSERMAVCVDTLLKNGLSDDTSRRFSLIMKTVEARRPERELMAAFAAPAPFGLCDPDRTVMHFSTPLLRVLPIGPVYVGSEEHSRLVKFAPLIGRLKSLNSSCPVYPLCLERIEFFMEWYRLSVEVMQCQSQNTSAIDHLSCNRPHLRVPIGWRRAYNYMGIENIDDLVIQ